MSSSVRRDVTIRRADVIADRERILAVQGRNLEVSSPARYDWLYLRNPAGPSHAWLAEDAATGAPVGSSAGHVRMLGVNGRSVRGLNLGDFCIDSAYRTLGPALKLLKASLTEVDAGGADASYGTPNWKMVALYQRLRNPPLGPSWRWARPVRLGARARRRWPGWRGALAGGTADLGLRLATRLLLPRPRFEVEPLAVCGPEVDELEEELARDEPQRFARSAAHLRWSYLDHPAPLRLLAARRAGRLRGYLAYRTVEDALEVVDLQGAPRAEVAPSLLGELIRTAQREGRSGVWMTAFPGTQLEALLAPLAFVRRESMPGMVLHAGPALATTPGLRDLSRWWLVDGDFDV
jgi:hypothetical protein